MPDGSVELILHVSVPSPVFVMVSLLSHWPLAQKPVVWVGLTLSVGVGAAAAVAVGRGVGVLAGVAVAVGSGVITGAWMVGSGPSGFAGLVGETVLVAQRTRMVSFLVSGERSAYSTWSSELWATWSG